MENPDHATHRNETIDITDNDYRTIAAALRDELQNKEWYNATIQGVLPGAEWRLVLSAIVYRRTDRQPEGDRRPVVDVVPVWWEFHTVGADGPVSNDFSFTQLKPFIIDYE